MVLSLPPLELVPSDDDDDDDDDDSAPEVVDRSRSVVSPAETPVPEEVDPPPVSSLCVDSGGEEKHPANPRHSHTQRSNLMSEVSHSEPRKKPSAPGHEDGAEGFGVELECV